MKNRIHQLVLISALALAGGTSSAQTVEYDVTVLPPVPGSWNWVVRGMNNHGELVGWAQFSADPFFLRGWKWSQAEGMILLPAPPGRDALRYAARDINDAGMVVGDGGGGSGEAWRLENGVYTLLGMIEGDVLSTARGINENGDLAGYSDNPSFGNPKHLFRYTDEGGMVSLLSGRGTGINDSRQVSGYFEGTFGGGWQAVRIDAAGNVQFLGMLPGRSDSFGNAINNGGQVVGESRSADSSSAFVDTDGVGMQAIPTVSRWNAATAINNLGHIVGSGRDPGRGFIWTPSTGTRLLTSLIDPALQLIVTGTSPTETPSELRFRLEAHADIGNIGQWIDLWNYDASAYEQVDFMIATLADSIVEISITTNPERFIQAGTKKMKARVNYREAGIVLLFPWLISFDQAVWVIDP